MPNLSETKFGRNGLIVTIASRSQPTSSYDAIALGRQYAHRDVGMQNLSGTKFGRNGVKCYDRFSLATHKRNIQLWDVNVPTSHTYK